MYSDFVQILNPKQKCNTIHTAAYHFLDVVEYFLFFGGFLPLNVT